MQAKVSFLIKLQAETCNFIKKETLAQVFPCELLHPAYYLNFRHPASHSKLSADDLNIRPRI